MSSPRQSRSKVDAEGRAKQAIIEAERRRLAEIAAVAGADCGRGGDSGALGLVLPSLLRIAPKLTPLAAVGLVAVMLGATVTHAIRGEFAFIGVSVVLGGLAGFVAWGRAVAAPISARAQVVA